MHTHTHTNAHRHAHPIGHLQRYSMARAWGRWIKGRTGHHALEAAEVDVGAVVEQVEHLVGVLLHLVLDVHLAALGVGLLAGQRVVQTELYGPNSKSDFLATKSCCQDKQSVPRGQQSCLWSQ